MIKSLGLFVGGVSAVCVVLSAVATAVAAFNSNCCAFEYNEFDSSNICINRWESDLKILANSD